MKHKGLSGKPLTSNIPYGYKKAIDEKGNTLWVVDDETAPIVREIFRLYVDEHLSFIEIARNISGKGIIIPNVRKGRKVSGEADVWNDQTVKNILSNQVYCGDTVNFKTEKISFKDQRRINHNPSEWKIFEDTHQAIISRELFEQVKKLFSEHRKNRTFGLQNPLRYFLFCFDCNSRMYARRFQDEDKNVYVCHKNCTSHPRQCSSHSVREKYLYDLLIEKLNKLIEIKNNDPQKFRELIYAERLNNTQNLTDRSSRRLLEIDSEIDILQNRIKKIYIEKENGELSYPVFSALAEQFAKDIETLKYERIEITRKLNEIKKSNDNLKIFLLSIDKFDKIYYNDLNEVFLSKILEKILVEERTVKYSRVPPIVHIHFLGIGEISFI
ncbi:MAG: recombinase family protein [Oscillospiraceae bacterium]|jgi:hypothetical protein|nr:recombinase family protein [Oscillospiraceae bacterium]